MKAISEGCRAVIVNLEQQSHYNGTILTVGKYHGLNEGQPCWETDKFFINGDGGKVSFLFECCLQRIDDYDGHTKSRWDALVDADGNAIWSPDRILVES